MRLQDKTALLVGCSPNINAGIALGLAEEGARLVCVDVMDEYARACADAIVRGGGQAIAVHADATQEPDVQAAVRAAQDSFGGIDILINGAVVQIRRGIRQLSGADFRRQMDVILLGAFLFTKHVAEAMIAQGRRGNIINIISTEGHQGNPGNVGYGTAKAGLLNFTRSVAMELAPNGIRVNSLTPTATDPTEGDRRIAEWNVNWSPPTSGPRSGFTSGNQGIPLGKRPSPSHYAKAVAFLASDDAEMITGFDLRVDGGTIARYWRWNPGVEALAKP